MYPFALEIDTLRDITIAKGHRWHEIEIAR